MPLTLKQFRALIWELKYNYGDTNKGFKVFGCDLKDISIVHDHAKGKKTKIGYRVAGRSTDSPSVAVRWYNARHTKERVDKQKRGEEIGA